MSEQHGETSRLKTQHTAENAPDTSENAPDTSENAPDASADCQAFGHPAVEARDEATEPAATPAEGQTRSAFLTLSEDPEEAAARADLPEHRSDVASSTATVKIMLMPEGHVMTVAFAIGLSISALKQHFADELKVPSEVLQICLDGQAVEDQRTLMDLGVQPHGTTQLEMTSSDPEKHPVRPAKPPQEYNMPDVIAVRVQTDCEGGVFQDVVVEIDRATQRKAFLGGYRHRLSGTEFHHAAVQTTARRPPDRGVETFSRDTQTQSVSSQGQQSGRGASTQTSGVGCYVSGAQDRLVAPARYVSAAQHHHARLRAVLTLQTYARRWQARRLTGQLRQERALRLAWVQREESRKKEEKEQQVRAELRRRTDPQSKGDFALLYNAVEKWRRQEVERIEGSLAGAERKAALCALLEEEARLIASIGRHRIVATERNHDNAVKAFLDKCAAPKRWQAFDGKTTQMDTQFTLRAKELRDLYTSLTLPPLGQDDRLDVLLTLKHTVKEHDCKLTKDIVELIDREADLMGRGVKETNLEGLRKRISSLFLQYIKTPSFNPEVAKTLKVPQDPSQLRKDVYFCGGCSRYLRSADLCLVAGGRLGGRCRGCTELDNEARRRDHAAHYRTILRRLRRAEAQASSQATITHLLQEQDMRYLVELVWGARSALSACSDLHDLLMERWDPQWPWSPWNCILLTKDEAAAHLRVDNVEKAYGLVFIRNVTHKHTLAKKHFSQIPVMAQFLQDTDAQPAAHGNLLVAKPITTATAKTLTKSPQTTQ